MTYGVRPAHSSQAPAASGSAVGVPAPIKGSNGPPVRLPTGLDARVFMTEDQIQRAVFQHINKRGAPGLIAFHPKNGGIHQENVRQRITNAQMGVLPGIPDVIMYLGKQLYCLELKALKGKLSAEQQSIGHMFRTQGAITGVAFGLDDAIAWLERNNLLIGKTI
jgi:hypothetical protein